MELICIHGSTSCSMFLSYFMFIKKNNHISDSEIVQEEKINLINCKVNILSIYCYFNFIMRKYLFFFFSMPQKQLTRVFGANVGKLEQVMFTQSSNPDFRLRILSEPCSAILSSAAETQAGVILLFSSTWNRERGGGCITFFLRFRELFRPYSSLAPGTP